MKSWLQDNNIEMYSTHNERNYVVDENLFRTLKNTIYKYMTSISKNGIKMVWYFGIRTNEKDLQLRIMSKYLNI